ncbi:MAG: hypothetical protein ACE5PV_07250 [Candidatus Poribacteria bacterium]
MNPRITPHEPKEELVSSVEEVFQDVLESEKRWREWERKHQRKPIRIDLSQSEYDVLEDLAKKQGKTVPQVVQALLDGVLSALMPHSHKLEYE